MKPPAEPASLFHMEMTVRSLAARCVNRDGTIADETLLTISRTDAEMLRSAGKVLMWASGVEDDFLKLVAGKRRRRG